MSTAAYTFGSNNRFYLAKGASYSTIRNSSGVASLAGTDACKHASFTPVASRERIAAADIEATAFAGFIDQTRQGRFSGTASVAMALRGGSAAGTAPDCGPLLESALGKVTAGGSTMVYASASQGSVPKYLDESTPVTCEMWGFNPGATRGACAYGGLVNKLTLSAGQSGGQLSADLICYYVLGQDRFSAASTAEKGGLTAWPSEPSTPAYTGSEVNTFSTLVTLDGVAYNARSVSVSCNFNRGYRMDKCAIDGTEFLGYGPYEMEPEFLLDVSLFNLDSNGTDLSTLLGKVSSRTAFDASVVIGTTAGGIYTVALNNLIMPGDKTDVFPTNGDDRQVIELKGLRAQASSTSVRDEISLTIS
jgi:hypothetical protein